MFSLSKPTAKSVRAFLETQEREPLTYSEVGASVSACPAGYRINHTRLRLGSGEPAFRAARDALRCWTPFDLGWVGIVPAGAPVEAGETVAVVARCLGLWWVNACRIVTVLDGERRFGFACGTLPGHAGTGEECFTVEWDDRDGCVWYEVRSFSRPRHPLVRLAGAYLRVVQRRFGRESGAAMRRAMVRAGLAG